MLPTLTHPTLAALVAAIRAEPDDDTVRLVLADWYEENGDPARAEFIRVQVELARVGFRNCNNPQCSRGTRQPPMNWCVKCLEWNDVRQPLQARSDALLAEHEARWRRGERCGRCCVPIPRKDGIHRVYESAGPDSRWVTCEDCHGTGWSRWWLVERQMMGHHSRSRPVGDYKRKVHWERGLIVQVDANLSDIFDGERATEWALAVVRGEPGGRRFGVVDKRPMNSIERPQVVFYREGVTDNDEHTLPVRIFEALQYEKDITPEPSMGRYWRTDAAANTALATAAWAEVKRQAE